MTVRLASGDSICTLLPHAGGSIGSWSIAGQDMLRRAVSEHDPLGSASFPLLPYSNRSADACFDWQGESIVLQPHKIAMPHAIHGMGWERKWQITEAREKAASLRLVHGGDATWPWPFEAEQHFEVDETSLILGLKACSLADQPVPLAFGHHPYFDNAGASLRFVAQHFYPSDESMLPLAREAISAENDFSQSAPVSRRQFDNVYGGWSGSARVEWADRPLALMIESNLPDAVLYTPPDADFFCFEPVPHVSNALNREDSLIPIVKPGECFTAQIRFTGIPA